MFLYRKGELFRHACFSTWSAMENIENTPVLRTVSSGKLHRLSSAKLSLTVSGVPGLNSSTALRKNQSGIRVPLHDPTERVYSVLSSPMEAIKGSRSHRIDLALRPPNAIWREAHVLRRSIWTVECTCYHHLGYFDILAYLYQPSAIHARTAICFRA